MWVKRPFSISDSVMRFLHTQITTKGNRTYDAIAPLVMLQTLYFLW